MEFVRPDSLRPYAANARRHSKKQIRQIADSIQRFGFNNPVLISADGEIIAGHGRVEAAQLLKLDSIPVRRLSHLSETERRAYILADNKLALNAGWDTEILALELQNLSDIGFEVELTGFSLAEIDLTISAAEDAKADGMDAVADAIPEISQISITRTGDLWQLGRHRLKCGDARMQADYAHLLNDDRVDLIFTDPPYNVPISGHVSGLGRKQHREFAMASGEMSQAEFTNFLEGTLGLASKVAKDGAIAFVCMDWRHMQEMLSAGGRVFSELKNLCVWNKNNGGMGAFYRSKHELVFVFKVGTGPHINAFGLGETGRPRTNVWDYPGVRARRAERRIASGHYSRFYFAPTPAAGSFTPDDEEKLDGIMEDRAALGDFIVAMSAQSRPQGSNMGAYTVDALVQRFNALSPAQRRAILLALGDTMDKVVMGLDPDEFAQWRIWEAATLFLDSVIGAEADDLEREQLMQELIGGGAAVEWLMRSVSRLQSGKARRASRGLGAPGLSRAVEILLQRLQSDVPLDTLPYLLDFLWSWRRLGDENGPREYVERHTTAQEDFLVVMKGLRSWMYSDKAYRPINRPDTEPFLDGDAARLRLEMIASKGGEAAELARELLDDMRIGDSNYREGQETFYADGNEKRYSPTPA